MLESRADIERVWREQEIARVLVDGREVTSLPNTLRLFEFGSSFCKSDTPSSVRFALVPSPAVRNDADFLETVMRNRGTVARRFDTIAAAIDWLKQE